MTRPSFYREHWGQETKDSAKVILLSAPNRLSLNCSKSSVVTPACHLSTQEGEP